MSAPICGARTWVTPDETRECHLPAGHADKHESEDKITWYIPRVVFLVTGVWQCWTVDEARSARDRLQRQLDALDPDAAVAESERRMVEARDRAVRLLGLAASRKHVAALGRASKAAYADECAAVDTWLALVEARDAKGGGA